MSELDFTAFDADNHYYEAPDAFTRHVDPSMQRRCVEWCEIGSRKYHVVGGTVSHVVKNPTIAAFDIERAAEDWLLELMFNRMFDRFPNLRIASVENGSTFLGDLVKKLDSQLQDDAGLLGRAPSGGPHRGRARRDGAGSGHLRLGLAAHRGYAIAARLLRRAGRV